MFDDEIENTDEIDDDNDNESLSALGSFYWETNKKCEFKNSYNLDWVLFEMQKNLNVKKLIVKFNHVQIKDDTIINYTIDIHYGWYRSVAWLVPLVSLSSFANKASTSTA